MEFSEVVRQRRMVRHYRPEPVDPGVLDRIIEAGISAPSAGFSQGQSFVVVSDPETRHRIASLAGEPDRVARGFDPWLSSAPVHIVVCASEQRYLDRYAEPDKASASDPADDWSIPYWWLDAGASFMAILLAVVDEGLAAGFLGAHAIPDLDQCLGLPPTERAVGVITVGHPAPDRRSGSLERGRRPRADVLHWNRWGGTESETCNTPPAEAT